MPTHTFSFTIWSNVSSPDRSADTCLAKWFHQADDENRCIIARDDSSMNTGGMMVGSAVHYLVLSYTDSDVTYLAYSE